MHGETWRIDIHKNCTSLGPYSLIDGTGLLTKKTLHAISYELNATSHLHY